MTSITIWGTGTPRSFRPIWVAEELGIEYEHRAIGPRTGETQTPEYQRQIESRRSLSCRMVKLKFRKVWLFVAIFEKSMEMDRSISLTHR